MLLLLLVETNYRHGRRRLRAIPTSRTRQQIRLGMKGQLLRTSRSGPQLYRAQRRPRRWIDTVDALFFVRQGENLGVVRKGETPYEFGAMRDRGAATKFVPYSHNGVRTARRNQIGAGRERVNRSRVGWEGLANGRLIQIPHVETRHAVRMVGRSNQKSTGTVKTNGIGSIRSQREFGDDRQLSIVKECDCLSPSIQSDNLGSPVRKVVGRCFDRTRTMAGARIP